MKAPPVESPKGPPAPPSALPATPKHPKEILPELPAILKIALYSSKRDRCGISTYTCHLEEALCSLGHEVRHWRSEAPYQKAFDEMRFWKPDIFHVQHETSIMPPGEELVRLTASLRAQGTRAVITLHTDNPETIGVGRKVGRIILHRASSEATEAVVLPMPCTNLVAFPDRTALRTKFGFPEKAFLISTLGFMMPWKDHPRILGALVPWLKTRPDVEIQVIASEHFNKDLRDYADLCRSQISQINSDLGGRARHVDAYPSDLEVIERLAASDLGYVWCPFDTGSSSAAAAQFTTARCPLVATDSSHYANLGTGVLRAPMDDLGAFTQLIQKTADDPGLLLELRSNQSKMYNARNYLETAKKHVLIYGGKL